MGEEPLRRPLGADPLHPGQGAPELAQRLVQGMYDGPTDGTVTHG
ncbi:hypothetical protein ACWF76_13565 [Streptomyces globisporus]|nr:hypothetical protein [Streptomyces sp. MCL20-2]